MFDIDVIDLHYLGLPGAAAAFLFEAEGPVLVECGPAATFDRLVAELDARGLRPQEIRALFVTHVHLDHAGAAGHFARLGVPIHVHPLGARHLSEPERLIASSRRVHGAAFDRFYGPPIPCPDSLVHPVADGVILQRGDTSVRALATPGHAKHHHAWIIEHDNTRTIMAGDVAAMIAPQTRSGSLDGAGFLSLPTPPPDFDREAWHRSLDALRREGADRLLLTHFGPVDDPAAHLDAVDDRLRRETDEVLRLLGDHTLDGPTEDPHARRVAAYREWLDEEARARGVLPERCSPAVRSTFLGSGIARMNLDGVARWNSVRNP